MERHLMVVLAHPDDESFGCGGTIALHARAGTPVTYVCATRGEMGRHMGRPPFATRETLRGLREQELQAACAALGIGELRLLGLWDKTVEFEDREVLATRIQAIIAEARPSLVITFHPVHGGHQDHCAIGAATIRAVERMAPAERPRLHCMIHPRLVDKLPLKAEPVEIADVVEVKLAAIRAHRSQSQGMNGGWAFQPDALERARREWPREYFMAYM